MSKLDSYEKVEARIHKLADEQAQKAIETFREDVAVALRKLLCLESHALTNGYGRVATPHYPSQEGRSSHNVDKTIQNAREVLERLLVLDSRQAQAGWPVSIWAARRKALADEVLAQFSSVQKLLMVDPAAPPAESACTPAEVPPS